MAGTGDLLGWTLVGGVKPPMAEMPWLKGE